MIKINRFVRDYFNTSDLGLILKIALPIILSNGSLTVMHVTDRWFLSKVGQTELAASMSGGLTSHVLISFFAGLIGYVSALVAQYYGANQPKKCTRAIIQAFYLAFVSYPLLILCIPIIKYVFIWTNQEQELSTYASLYARTMLTGCIFFLMRTVVGSFFIGLGKTRIILIANAIGTLLNIPFNFVLIFGKLGLPKLGVQGAALATIFASCISFIILFSFFLREISQVEFKTRRLLKIDGSIIKKLFSFGLPAGVEPFLNLFAFNIFLQMMHSYGTDTASAVTIAFTWDSVVYLPFVGLGMTARTIVGQNLGARNSENAQRMTYMIMGISLAYGLVMILVFNLLTGFLSAIFAPEFQGPNSNSQNISNIMIRLISLYTIANSCKMILGNSLQAAGDTLWVMLVSISIHWAMAISVVLLVQIFKVNQYVAFSTLIVMINLDFITKFYRYQTAKWRNINLID